ncbi:DUF3658 domain-containing protein [Paenibacillus lemnae]|uniref:DUF3658 domain-containing protein n=1 Tax=Paenibacillus lemnae TaxID=1330551 RepID=UPI001FE85EDF|nr:DUF1835 domain-containing protein [Paenibacillus lemnae]
MKHDPSGHDWWHIVRVTRTAKMLAMSEGADEYICELSALLHDIPDEKLNPSKEAGTVKLKKWMDEEQLLPEDQETILNIINSISFGKLSEESPLTLEAQIVQDADRLDAMGAIGIARTFTYAGSRGRLMFNPDIKPRAYLTPQEYRTGRSTTINHFYEKLLKLKSQMNTESAKILARKRHNELEKYLEAFQAEWSLGNESFLEEMLGLESPIKKVHIVFDRPSFDVLGAVLSERPHEHIVLLGDDLSIGPLPGVNDADTHKLRRQWLTGLESDSETKDQMQEEVLDSAFKWRALPAKLAIYPLTIWASDSAHEQVGLRRLMSLLPEAADIAILNPTALLSNHAVQYYYTGEIVMDKLESLLGKEIVPSADIRRDLVMDWERLLQEDQKLRILQKGEVISVSESYFDVNIMKSALELGARNKWVKALRVASEAMFKYTDQRVSQLYFEDRIQRLVSQNLLQAQGLLTSMRTYSVTITKSGTEFLSSLES